MKFLEFLVRTLIVTVGLTLSGLLFVLDYNFTLWLLSLVNVIFPWAYVVKAGIVLGMIIFTAGFVILPIYLAIIFSVWWGDFNDAKRENTTHANIKRQYRS
jgi:hypothetical protein